MKLIQRITDGMIMPYGLSYASSSYSGFRINLRFKVWRKFREGYDIRYMDAVTDWWSYDVIIRLVIPPRRFRLWPRFHMYHDWTLED